MDIQNLSLKLGTPKQQLALSAEIRNVIHERNMLTNHTRRHILLALEEVHNKNVEADRINKRIEIIKEILSSEESYLRQLNIIKTYFMKPLSENCILKTKEYGIIFGGLQTLLNINEKLFKHLNENPENVAQTFLEIAPYLKLYSVYAYNYKNCMTVLQKVTSSNGEFSKFLNHQESRPEVQKKLTALLITPIQRVPRYRLLLKDLLDNTTCNDSFFTVLQDALTQVEKAAEHINNFVDEHENTLKLIKIQQSLQNGCPVIIKPGRKLLKEGILSQSFSNNESKQQYIVLLNDIILCCKLKKSDPYLLNSIKVTSILPLKKCRVSEILNKGAFRIICEEETLTFYHHSAENIQQWINILRQTILNCKYSEYNLKSDFLHRRINQKKEPICHKTVDVNSEKFKLNDPIEKKHIENYSSQKVMKRKAIRDILGNTKNKKFKSETDSIDVSPPLYLKNKVKNNEHCEENNASVEIKHSGNSNMFIYGDNNRRSFYWTTGNLFMMLTNSLKNMFNFK